MRRSTPAVTVLTGAALALALTACGGGAARQQASGPAQVPLAAAQAPAETGVSAASGSKAAAPAAAASSAAAAPAAAGARSATGSGGRKTGNGGSARSAASSSTSASTSAAATTQQNAPAAGTVSGGGSGGGGGGGGGKTTAVKPPADWPATVPVPAGAITAASGAVSHWTMNITAKGADTVVIAKLVALYQGNGFTLDPAFNNPKVLHHNRLTMTVFWRNRDHGPEATEVLLVLDKA